MLRKDAADALENMFEAAKKEGLELTAVSGYRSYKRQKSLHDTYVRRQGKAEADSVSAIPGTSEHQTGLAMDISSKSAKFQLEPILERQTKVNGLQNMLMNLALSFVI